MKLYVWFSTLIFTSCLLLGQDPILNCKPLDNDSYELTIDIQSSTNYPIYSDYIQLSANHPDIKISEWHASCEPSEKYDTNFKSQKKLFEKPVRISCIAQGPCSAFENASLFISYMAKPTQKTMSYVLPFLQKNKPDYNDALPASNVQTVEPPSATSVKQSPSCAQAYKEKILSLFTQTESWGIRLLLTVLLGLLLSLTPCIYPMIPITMGILQSHGSKSMGRNFLIALTYVLGIATTFATLGTVAAFSGQMFGSFMKSPFIIIGIVCLLAYLAGSMLGLYEMYTPRFLQSHNSSVGSGSLLSIFLFGAASGTVASPCLSPGLVLLLTMVTAIGSIPLGFIMLFFFGLGLGIPLLIIGTFSGSLSMMPRAGMWMIDVKQFFGFIMLGTCLYFLSAIIPSYIIAWFAAAYTLCVGIFYLYTANKTHKSLPKIIKNVLGIVLIAVSIHLTFEAYKETDRCSYAKCPAASFWMYDFSDALTVAQKHQKKMLIDIGAPYCSICKAIDKKIFSDTSVQEALSKVVSLKIGDIEENETTLSLQKKFNVMGAPTIVLYDPQTEKELKRWGGDLYDCSPAEFIAMVEAVL